MVGPNLDHQRLILIELSNRVRPTVLPAGQISAGILRRFPAHRIRRADTADPQRSQPAYSGPHRFHPGGRARPTQGAVVRTTCRFAAGQRSGGPRLPRRKRTDLPARCGRARWQRGVSGSGHDPGSCRTAGRFQRFGTLPVSVAGTLCLHRHCVVSVQSVALA